VTSGEFPTAGVHVSGSGQGSSPTAVVASLSTAAVRAMLAQATLTDRATATADDPRATGSTLSENASSKKVGAGEPAEGDRVARLHHAECAEVRGYAGARAEGARGDAQHRQVLTS